MCKHDEGKLGNQRGGGLLSNAWQEDAGDTFYDNHCCHLYVFRGDRDDILAGVAKLSLHHIDVRRFREWGGRMVSAKK